jgi:hypothetical protein
LQPQTPPRQTWPTALLLQSRQLPPVVPQALLLLPSEQLPLAQQPPVQLPLDVPPQLAVQAPLAQVGVSPLQLSQAAPALPHDELFWLA